MLLPKRRRTSSSIGKSTLFRRLIFAALPLLFALPASAGSVLGEDFNEDDAHDYKGLPDFRLSIEGGFSQWMIDPDSVSAEYKTYDDDLKRGWDGTAELDYFPWPKGGIGFTWIWFLSRASATNITHWENEQVVHDFKDRASFVYIGPTFLSRLRLGRKGMLVAGFGGGYLDVSDNWTDNTVVNKVTAHNFALMAEVGWDREIHRYLAIGINGRFVFSNLRDYTYNGKQVRISDPENKYMWYNVPLERLELNLGLRFQL